MSEPTPYEQLGVSENASYDEIRAARDRLQQEFAGEELQQTLIESAYDAILMERLKARKEGKIPVPEGIRFPERLPASSAIPNLPNLGRRLPSWLVGIYLPDQKNLLFGGGGYLLLLLFSIYSPGATASAWLPLGLLASFWGIWRKQNKFGRSCLFSLGGFLVGVLLGAGLGMIPGLPTQVLTSMVIFTVMWLVTGLLG